MKASGFPTKKSMAAAKSVADISQDEMDKYLTGAKDEDIDNQPSLKETYTTNVNVDENVNNALALIGRGSAFEKNFQRQTYYVHNDIIKQIDKLSKKCPKGTKTKIINAALKAYIDNLS